MGFFLLCSARVHASAAPTTPLRGFLSSILTCSQRSSSSAIAFWGVGRQKKRIDFSPPFFFFRSMPRELEVFFSLFFFLLLLCSLRCDYSRASQRRDAHDRVRWRAERRRGKRKTRGAQGCEREDRESVFFVSMPPPLKSHSLRDSLSPSAQRQKLHSTASLSLSLQAREASLVFFRPSLFSSRSFAFVSCAPERETALSACIWTEACICFSSSSSCRSSRFLSFVSHKL